MSKYNILNSHKRVIELEKEIQAIKSIPNGMIELDALKKSLKEKEAIINNQAKSIEQLKRNLNLDASNEDLTQLNSTIEVQSKEIDTLKKNQKSGAMRALDIIAGQGVSCDMLPTISNDCGKTILQKYQSMQAGKERLDFFKKHEDEILQARI